MGLLRFLEVERAEIMNVEFPVVKQRIVDKIIKTVLEGRKSLIQMEIQLQHRQNFVLRLFGWSSNQGSQVMSG